MNAQPQAAMGLPSSKCLAVKATHCPGAPHALPHFPGCHVQREVPMRSLQLSFPELLHHPEGATVDQAASVAGTQLALLGKNW